MANTIQPLGQWEPWNPREVAAFFASLQTPWWIAGGWAIDLFLGRQTRDHDDVDVQILRRDQYTVRSLFQAWDMQAALPPPRDEVWPFRPWDINEELDRAIHDIWCRPTSTQPWAMQLMIADTHDDLWTFRRAPAIARSLDTLGSITTEGIPYLAPEIQLLYKAKGLRPKDEDDFTQTLPFLNQVRRHWLKNALNLISPRHPWLPRLG